MFNKKHSAEVEPEVSDLEKQVDAYMDPEIPARKAAALKQAAQKDSEGAPAAGSSLAGAPALPPLDIFEGHEQPIKEAADQPKPAKDTDKETEPVAADAAPTEEPVLDEPILDTAEIDAAPPPAAALRPEIETIDLDSELPESVTSSDEADIEADAADTAKKPVQKRNFLAAWWCNRPARYGTLALLFIGLVAAGMVPTSRYYVLNTAGVRAASSITVMDRTTQLPLKNVAVTVGDVTGKTDKDGWVRLDDVRLGTQQLKIKRLGFAEVERTVTLGLGSNPLGEEQLKAVGTQYAIEVKDFLSGKPVPEAEASSGEATAVSDSDGTIILTLGQIDTEKVSISVTADGYRSEKLTIDAGATEPQKLTLVTRQKNVFVSKQSGTYDVFQIDVDGKNKKLLLEGTGNENEQISLVQHPTKDDVAIVSRRDTKRNQDGFQLKTLTVIRSGQKEPLNLDSSEALQIVDWTADKLVYVKVKAGTSAGNPERYQLMSYDADTAINTQLATANYFSDIVSAKGAIYYAATNNYQAGKSQFVRVNPNNGNKQVLHNGDVWTIYRTKYDTLMISARDSWLIHTLGSPSVKKTEQSPSNVNDKRFYLDSLNQKQSLWTEARDGKGVLLAYDADAKKDKVLATRSGLTYPLKWLSNEVVVFRVVTPAETADYAMSIKGGEPRKIADVTNASGFGRWFYY